MLQVTGYPAPRDLAKRDKLQEKGFTVVEMLVVLAVVGLISSVIFANYRGQQRESSLIRSAQKLALDLRRAQNLALSSTLHYSQIPYGYGVHLDKNVSSYVIFAKCDSTNLYYNPAGNACWTAYEEKIGTFGLESGVSMKTLKGLGGSPTACPNAAADKLDIVFKPPEPTTTVVRDSFNSPLCNTAEITLELEQDTTKTKRVIISTTGEIKIQ